MNEQIIKKIDSIIEEIECFDLKKAFYDEKKIRLDNTFVKLKPKEELLELLSKIIVYSQNANSESVSKVLQSKNYTKAFENFNIELLSKKNPCDIADEFWEDIKGIRQQTKIYHIITIARGINSKKFNFDILNKLPKKIENLNDIEIFWHQFNIIQKKFKKDRIPFFQSTTSLLHLLMELGFDCAKPDLVVMKVSNEIGLVDKNMNNKNFINVVKTIQEYAIIRKIRPSIIDLYFLVKGEQKATKKYVN